jgi:hypothetical protein
MEDGEKSEPVDPEDAAVFAALDQEMADLKGRSGISTGSGFLASLATARA